MPCCNSCGSGGICDSANLMKFQKKDVLYAGLGLLIFDVFYRVPKSSTSSLLFAALAGYVGVKLALRFKPIHEEVEDITQGKYLLPFELIYLGMRYAQNVPYYSIPVALVGSLLVGKFAHKPDAPPTIGTVAHYGDIRGPHSVAGWFQPSGHYEPARRGLTVNWP